MSEVASTGFLIRGTKEKSEGDVFQEHHLHQIPIWTGLRVAFPCFIPMHIGYTACTIREQFGNRYASTVWWFWHIIDVMDGIFPLFPYLLLYRTEEVAGSNPARSTELPCMEYLHHTGLAELARLLPLSRHFLPNSTPNKQRWRRYSMELGVRPRSAFDFILSV